MAKYIAGKRLTHYFDYFKGKAISVSGSYSSRASIKCR